MWRNNDYPQGDAKEQRSPLSGLQGQPLGEMDRCGRAEQASPKCIKENNFHMLTADERETE
jgi:hypothetical protein